MKRVAVRWWYEAWTPNGKLWCGSSDPDEVVRMSEGVEGIEFSQLITFEQTTREPWEPKR